MSTKDLLVELGVEELPPKSLSSLSAAFSEGVRKGLKANNLAFDLISQFATPRRLALLVTNLDEAQADRTIEKFGPATKTAYDAQGNPTSAAQGFARSCGVSIDELSRANKDGIEKLFFSSTQKGLSTEELIPAIVADSLSKLPIPKKMRWGSSRIEFVRPVHWLLMLFGKNKLNANILGIDADAFTMGHRFHCNTKLVLESPSNYENVLLKQGFVIADFEKRKQKIEQLVREQAENIGASVIIDEDLLNEVTSLVEYPVALLGNFEREFLDVPAEALVSAMKSHQKCFNLVDENQNLLPHFIAVSNIVSNDPKQVIRGNERVIRPRLADARFFFETDKKRTLESRREQLKHIVFQDKLGTIYQKSERVANLAREIALKTAANPAWCKRAAQLSKCDLVTTMVGEFADLQGLMGCYYARHDGEPGEVATAITEQYMPRFSGDDLPQSETGAILALADKLDTITGLFAIGQPPTGSKDPFALRRAAIGALRIIVERKLDIDLQQCIEFSVSELKLLSSSPDLGENIFDFMLERFRAWYKDKGVSVEVFLSVFALKPVRPVDFDQRIRAVEYFSKLEQANSLAAANKRVANILADISTKNIQRVPNADLLIHPAEKALANAIANKEIELAPLLEARQYKEVLQSLTELRDTIDLFFDEVLVMVDEPDIRANRIALLYRIRKLFLEVADISLLHKT